MGGEPTFVSIDDMDGAEWNFAALGREQARARGRAAAAAASTASRPAALLHYGQGKWYPGEPLPRWALTCLWRTDGVPLWRDAKLLAEDGKDYGLRAGRTRRRSRACWRGAWACTATTSSRPTRMSGTCSKPEQRRAGQLSIRSSATSTTPAERSRLARLLRRRDAAIPVGFVLPLKPAPEPVRRAAGAG